MNLLIGTELARFLSTMLATFTGFAPLGVVLVAMLGVGVAEHSGFIGAALKSLLRVTSQRLLTPMLILVAIVSHTAADVGYVLVIPLGGVIFYAAGRHPLAGIAAAFAGVSGGFSANFIPAALDPLLQGFTQSAAQIVSPGMQINPLNNWFFTSASCLVIVGLGWWLTDRVVEPRLASTKVDGDPDEMQQLPPIEDRERRALRVATAVMIDGVLLLVLALLPSGSPLRAPDGAIASFSAPVMQSIVPLIFLLFIIPGTVYGFAAGTLIAVEGGNFLRALALPGPLTLAGLILIVAFVNLFIGSASAKWALLAPILVPMLMQMGFSPDLTQAAYRVGDSTTNIITPLMPYFPLVVVYAQRYVKNTGIGTLVSMMLPYSLTFLVVWSVFLALHWTLGIPLGLQASYTYP